MDSGTLKFYKPLEKYKELLTEFDVDDIILLINKLKNPKCKEERELLYGIIFTECLNRINKNDYLIRLPNEDTDCDFEVLDFIQWKKNQKASKNKRVTDHWRIQNVMITEHPVKKLLQHGINNIYEIFAWHLYDTKLSPRKGDYSGCILVFYLSLKLNEKLNLNKIRESIRAIEQNKVEQIYIVVPYLKELDRKFTIAELLISDQPAITIDF